MSEKDYWNERYQKGQTGWDLGAPSPALVDYFNQLTNKKVRILIPGCGNAYEAEYLHQQGFTNVHVIDISDEAVKSFKNRYPDFPVSHIHNQNFFEHQGEYNLIIEQTFFCALNPAERTNYRNKMHELLAPKGKIVGLLFTIPIKDSPPYGGTQEEYQTLFASHFKIDIMQPACHSHNSRAGVELFIKLIKA